MIKRFNKFMKIKGYTLVELLAVIVILGVLILIATTSITSIVKSSREKAFLNSAEQYLRTIKTEEIAFEDDNDSISVYRFPDYQFKALDRQPDGGFIVRNSDGEYKIQVWSNGLKKCAVKDFNESEITISQTIKKKGQCTAVNPDEYIDEDNLGPDEYQIAFHANGGKNPSTNATMFIQTFTFGESSNINENPFALDHYDFVEWNTNKNGTGTSYVDEAPMLKEESGIKTYHLYARWNVSSSILLTGSEFNSKIKTIANNTTTNWWTADSKIKGFEKSSVEPDSSLKISNNEISVVGTKYPVYAWFDSTDEKIKWWSESLDVRLNATSNNMFSSMTKMVSVDLSGINYEDVTALNSLFYRDSELLSVNFGTVNTPNLRTIASMFEDCQKITSIDLSMFTTNNVTNMESTFRNCKKLDTLVLDGLNTRKVESMVSMFQGAQSMVTIDLSSFYDDELTNMASMFSGCTNLTSVIMPHFSTYKVANMYAIFNGCTSIENINISQFHANALTMINNAFNGDTKLKTVDMSGMVLTQNNINFQYTFQNCKALTTVYVNSNFDETKIKADDNVFKGSNVLVGGSGTTCPGTSNYSSEYARIDNPSSSKPGYFTAK